MTTSQTITLANRNVLTRCHFASGWSDDLANAISLRPHGALPTIPPKKHHRTAMLRGGPVLSMTFVTTRIGSHAAAVVQLDLRADGLRSPAPPSSAKIRKRFMLAYIPEQHSENTRCKLPRSKELDVNEFLERLKTICWGSANAH